MFEFHIASRIREQCRFNEELFTTSGNVIFPHFQSVKEFTALFNHYRTVNDPSAIPVRAGEINALGLIDEICHFLVRYYEENINPGVIRRAIMHLEEVIGTDPVQSLLKDFLQEFPPRIVFSKVQTIDEYLEEATSGRTNREIALEEMIMVFIVNSNPAVAGIKEMISDESLKDRTPYTEALKILDSFFAQEKSFGSQQNSLLFVLQSHIIAAPSSLEEQLKFLKKEWGLVLKSTIDEKILLSFSYLHEEQKFLWHKTKGPGGGPLPVETFVPQYKQGKLTTSAGSQGQTVSPEDLLYAEPEQFTQDVEWMPNVVLLAKNIHVWLDQLSKKYKRKIDTLDLIPDEELDQIARWKFTGLWLIGMWERSTASKKIKQLSGNPDAVASAYSLYEYEIARDLGGEIAYQNLSHRAWQRGIRLAGDMVPNHMGIFSKWVIEHPEYFIQSEHSPYPNYRFTGPDLSDDPTVAIQIEDGYWNRNDAAVVFKRTDKRTGDVRYLYHGNDGTNMPWNDTAQLNLLRAEVREAIIQNIFHVARKFSIIRFDAAMTLAKKHFQRLWYPIPGTSGVPSRQDHSLSRSQFDTAFPNEFWREVVDRFNAEMPNTLLLAEAFWLMEGYFVRTLGMHRVYNSAFMHMLMKEENQKFRDLLKNTLEFNPEILKRYVNFMSNPDEQTAIAQFGNGDKYFGILTMMVTLPGLPMFAHGQIEGFTEKYGMEYQRAYYDEVPNEYLVRRHEQEIFPLMKKRYLYSQVVHFQCYDFWDNRGYVNENVFAYSNRSGKEKVLVIFHNSFAETAGKIIQSAPKLTGEESSGRVLQKSFVEDFEIHGDERHFYIAKEIKSQKEYLFSGKDLYGNGFHISLRAYEYVVFSEFNEVYDHNGEYQQIFQQLHGMGVPNIQSQLIDLRLRPFHDMIKTELSDPRFRSFHERILNHSDDEITAVSTIFHKLVESLLRGIGESLDERKELFHATQYFTNISTYYLQQLKRGRVQKEHLLTKEQQQESIAFCLIELIYHLVENSTTKDVNTIFDRLQLAQPLQKVLMEYHDTWGGAEYAFELISAVLRSIQYGLISVAGNIGVIESFFEEYHIASVLNFHQHNSTWYFNKERFENFILLREGFLLVHSLHTVPIRSLHSRSRAIEKECHRIISIAEESGYAYDIFREQIQKSVEKNIKKNSLTKAVTKNTHTKTPIKKSGKKT